MNRSLLALLLLVTAGAAGAGPAEAQGYLQKKDDAAIAAAERALGQVARDDKLFDGKAIPGGADLAEVRALDERLVRQLDAASRQFGELSRDGAARPQARTLMARWDELAAYQKALDAAYRIAAASADRAAADKAAADRDAKARGMATCEAFRKVVLADPANRSRLEYLAQIDAGANQYWSDTEQGAEYIATLHVAAEACARPDFADVAAACKYSTYEDVAPEARWCAAAAHAPHVIERSALNLAAFYAEHLDIGASPDHLADNQGWIPIEGAVTWADYFSGAELRKKIRAQIQPVFAQAGLDGADDAAVFAGIDQRFAALEAKVRELAPTWRFAGSACSGVACSAARKTVTGWYPKAKLVGLHQDAAGWTIVQNDLGIPTHRYKSGTALLRLPGEPFCQLRSWEVSEDHKGGGRYQSASRGTLGYVRWQRCK